jgi:hypothetical protein
MNVKAAVRMVALVVLLSSLCLWAQAPKLNPKVPPEQQIPVVKFEFVMPGSVPPHYALSVEAGGAAAYRSDSASAIGTTPSSDGAGETPYFLKFDISAATAQRIFDLAKDLNFFRGDFEYHGRVANMGAKTLTFKDGKQDNSFTYNYTQNSQLQQLTSLMQGIAASLEYRRELEQLYKYEKLGIDEKLRQMEAASERGYLAELQVDEPILRQIANDPSIMNISRRTAKKLLATIK